MNSSEDRPPLIRRSSGEVLCALECGLLPEEAPDVRIGNYKLLQKIGEGGFGVVWMAEQQEPVRRTVALKVIKPGMDTAEVIARFEVERQALALMDHPNIAQVFDAGATDAGRPYFVMELVHGVPITRYCDESRVPLDARLRLFVVVCQAVQHAHQKGIIHRDLKPSNILVALHDGVPVPKVIDFGIVKATGQRLTENTFVTHFHVFIGTPAYTSPEQLEMSGGDVDTRTDIYSLGALLYELLTGRPPFDADALAKTGFDAMRRTLRENDPPRPSQRLSTLTEQDLAMVAKDRGTNAAKLWSLLNGDLDWIVMHCLEKDRTRRYETANGLAMDIRRHLENEPIVARPSSNTYRLRKFIRRHKIGFIATMAVAVSLVAGLIASSVLLLRAVNAEKAQSRLRHEADVARELETKRVSRAALSLADQLLEKGRIAEALAYLVHAAHKDPGNMTIAPRVASVLTSHNFLIPEAAPFQCGSRVLAMRYSNDGRSIFVGTEDGAFRIFDAVSGVLRREIHLGKNVTRDGWVFATGNDAVFAVSFVDKTIGLFDVASGRPVWPPIPLDPEIRELPPDGNGVELSPNARWLCARGFHGFCIWDATTGKIQAKRTFTTFHFGPEFTRDGTRLSFVCEDRVYVWSLPEFTPLFEPITIKRTYAPGTVLFPKFSPDGRFLLIFNPWEDVQVFETESGTMMRRKSFGNGFNGFSPDGRMFSVGGTSWDLLDVTTGKLTSLPGGGARFSGEETTSADGKFILTASTDGFPRLWETMTGRLVAEGTLQQHDNFHAVLSPDGTQVVLGTAAGGVFRLRVGRGAARPLILRKSPVARVSSAPFFERGSTRVLWFRGDRAVALDVASGHHVGGGFIYPQSDLPSLRLPNTLLQYRGDLRFFVIQDGNGLRPSVAWELADTGINRIGTLEGERTRLPGNGALPFSANGDLVARPKSLEEIGTWDLHTGVQVGPGCSYENQTVNYLNVDFSGDGKRVVSSVGDGTVVVWDIATGKVVTKLGKVSDSFCWSVQFSPDGTRLITRTARDEMRLWNASTGEPASVIQNGSSGGFSPDGRWFFTINASVVHIWDGRNGTPVSEFKGDGGRFSSDGERFAANDGLRDVRTGQLLTESSQPTALGEACDWSLNGRFLELSADNKFYILSVPLSARTPNPQWLLELAAICGAKKINEAGQCVDAPEVVTQIDSLRRELAALPNDAPYVEWGRWILDDSSTRSIAPGFTITPAEADKLETEGDQPTAQNTVQ